MSEQEQHGDRPGRYKLTELIEEGICGKLYRAQDTQRDKAVLIKLVAKSRSSDPEFLRHFHDRRAEQEILFEHPNIARVFDMGERGENYYVAVEEPGGERLHDRLKHAPLDPNEALVIMHQIAEALRAAHRREIVHGHLKPSDVFITREPTGRPLVKVLFADIGTAAADSILPLFGETRGAPKYMAPEVIEGGVPGPQSDLFALGVIGYELLTGKEPFPSRHPVGYLFANCQKALVPPHQARGDVPSELSLVVSRCLEKDPRHRYDSAQHLIDDLDRCLQSIKTGRVSAVPMGVDSAFAREYEIPVPERPAAKKRARSALMGALVAILVGAAGIAIGGLAGVLLRPHLDSLLFKQTSSDQTVRTAQLPPSPLPEPARQPPPESTASAERPAAQKERTAKAAYDKAMEEWRRYSLTGSYELAIATFKKVAKDHADSPYAAQAREMTSKAYCEWAGALAAEEKFEKATSSYREAVKIAPEDSEYAEIALRELPKVMARWADYWYKHGLYDRALKIYKDIYNEFPASVEAELLAQREPTICFDQGCVLWKQEAKLEEALSKFQNVLKTYPKSKAAEDCRKKLPLLYLDIASEKIKRGELAEAQQELSRIKSAYPDTAPSKQAALLEAEVLYRLYCGAVEELKVEDAERYFDTLASAHPRSKWMREALTHRLGLVPEQGEPMFDAATARSNFENAQSLAEGLNHEAALDALKSVIRHTESASDVNALAWEKLPEWTYFGALHAYGLQKANECEAMLEDLHKNFGHTQWAEQAAQTLQRIKNPPAGMVYVPEGGFYMGLSQDEIVKLLQPYQPPRVLESEEGLALVFAWRGYYSEMPKHIASTGAFYIDRTEVTNEQYMKFVQATGYRPPWKNGKFTEGAADKPVTDVSFDDALAYAKWAGKRLPTETEWEKAARGVDGRLYPWGNSFHESCAHHMLGQDAGTIAVGSYATGASPYGCLDMIGNVLEWTYNWFQPYPGNDKKDERAPYGTTHRVLRGGAWYVHDQDPIATRCSTRFPLKPDAVAADTGFRCVKDIE